MNLNVTLRVKPSCNSVTVFIILDVRLIDFSYSFDLCCY